VVGDPTPYPAPLLPPPFTPPPAPEPHPDDRRRGQFLNFGSRFEQRRMGGESEAEVDGRLLDEDKRAALDTAEAAQYREEGRVLEAALDTSSRERLLGRRGVLFGARPRRRPKTPLSRGRPTPAPSALLPSAEYIRRSRGAAGPRVSCESSPSLLAPRAAATMTTDWGGGSHTHAAGQQQQQQQQQLSDASSLPQRVAAAAVPECPELAREFRDGLIRAAPNEQRGAFVQTGARMAAHKRAAAMGREGALAIAHADYERAIRCYTQALEHYRPAGKAHPLAEPPNCTARECNPVSRQTPDRAIGLSGAVDWPWPSVPAAEIEFAPAGAPADPLCVGVCALWFVCACARVPPGPNQEPLGLGFQDFLDPWAVAGLEQGLRRAEALAARRAEVER
jgi:hypothetical protein